MSGITWGDVFIGFILLMQTITLRPTVLLRKDK